MSFVQTVIVVLPMEPDAHLDAALTAEGPRDYQLRRVQLDSGTTYAPLLTVYAGTYNRVADEILDWLASLPWIWSDGGWPYPREHVRVLTHHEYSDREPMIYRLTGETGWTRLIEGADP